MTLNFNLPPRIFEFYHLLFESFVKEFELPEPFFEIISVSCFIIACKVDVTSSRGRTSS